MEKPSGCLRTRRRSLIRTWARAYRSIRRPDTNGCEISPAFDECYARRDAVGASPAVAGLLGSGNSVPYLQCLEEPRDHVVRRDGGNQFGERTSVEMLAQRLEQRVRDLHVARHRVGQRENGTLQRAER